MANGDETVNLLLNASVVRIHQLPPKRLWQRCCRSFFCCIAQKPAKAMTDFQSAFYRDAQLLPGGWIFLLPTFSAAFRMLRQYRIILSADTASKVRQLPERCLSRKAEIVRYCLKFPRSRKPWSGSCPSCKIRNRAQNYSGHLQSGRKTGIIATVTCLSSSAG